MEPQLSDLIAAEQGAYEKKREEEEALLDQVAQMSQDALDAMPAGLEKRLVVAVDKLLSFNLGSAEGYLGHVGLPLTRELQQTLAAYGITPDYGQAIGRGRRRLSRY